jgi:rhamnose ABC transporter rhamnose-binding protein
MQGPRIGVMPKLVGIPYFNACEEGAGEAAKELGLPVDYDGPVTNDVAKQSEMIDVWIARGFNVIAVAPNDPDAIAPVLRKARGQGIKVLAWDADAAKDSRDFFVNQATYDDIGRTLIEVMAEGIGGSGETAIITGSLTAANQNIWMEHMREHIKKYPNMKIVDVRASEEDHQLAFERSQDVMKAYPDLKGLFGITSVSLPGTAEAVKQSGMADKVFVTGLSLPEQMRDYVKSGVVKKFVLWNPVDLGYLTVYAAKLLYEGKLMPGTFEAGRLGTITVKDDEVLLGPPLVFTKENIDDYSF